MSDHKINPFAKGTAVLLPAQLCDRFGRVLQEGDQIVVTVPQLQLFSVEKIVEVLDPKQPANLMDITVNCRLRFRAVRNEKIPEFIFVLTRDELPKAPEGFIA